LNERAGIAIQLDVFIVAFQFHFACAR